MGDVIKDFQVSDAPQFKGKSKEKKRQMAIAAKLSAERNEAYGRDALQKNYERETKKTTGETVKQRQDWYRKNAEAARKRMQKEEVEHVDEGATKHTNKWKKRNHQVTRSATKVKPMGSIELTRAAAVRMTRDAMKKEEVELDEAVKGTPMKDSEIRAHLQRYGYSKRNLSHLANRLTAIHKVKHTAHGDKIYKEEVEQVDERNKTNAIKRKMMDASRGAKFKVNNPVPGAGPEHKTSQAHNKAIGRALRKEKVEQQEAYKVPSNYAAMMMKKRKKANDKAQKSLKDPSHNPPWANSKDVRARHESVNGTIDEAKSQVQTNKEREISAQMFPNANYLNSSQRKKVKDAAKAALKKEREAKKAADAFPKKEVSKTSKGKTRTGRADPADKNIIMQLRKAQDLHTELGLKNHDIRVSPTRTVNVHSSVINKVLSAHDKFTKPDDKRKFRVGLIRQLRKR